MIEILYTRLMNINRRRFIALGTMTVLSGCKLFTASKEDYDDRLSVFLSDIHVKDGFYTADKLAQIVAEILRMNPLPKRGIAFGDIARFFGHDKDYAALAPLLRPLTDAGIELTLGLSNHDRRGHFLNHWPEYSDRTLVPEKIVTDTSLGDCDLVMLDTLHENHQDETKMCESSGQLTGDQWDWLRSEMPRRTRPFFLGAHHSIQDIKDGDPAAVSDLIMNTPNCVGWIHGHNHVYKSGFISPSNRKWGDNTFKRWLCLPSSGYWGDIGYVKFSTKPNLARADLVMKDRYFPNNINKSEIDADIVREKQNAFTTFRWKKA